MWIAPECLKATLYHAVSVFSGHNVTAIGGKGSDVELTIERAYGTRTAFLELIESLADALFIPISLDCSALTNGADGYFITIPVFVTVVNPGENLSCVGKLFYECFKRRRHKIGIENGLILRNSKGRATMTDNVGGGKQ
jgi:hypothetical protein